MKDLPERHILEQNFKYEPNTGSLYRILQDGSLRKLKPRSDGVYRLQFQNKYVSGSHAAWCLMTGDNPRQVFFKDGDSTNLTWDNLTLEPTRKLNAEPVTKAINKHRRVSNQILRSNAKGVVRNYVNNKDLLIEIDRSKQSYSWYANTHCAVFSFIGEIEDLQDLDKNTVLRVMCEDHIPDDTARTFSGRLKLNFQPYKHYIVNDSNEIEEVGRSHWQGSLSNGHFSCNHGKITDKLALMYMLMVEKYSKRANWRNYSYLEDMRSSALMALVKNGLQFDESRSDNPFAYYTTIMTTTFIKTLKDEQEQTGIQDELLMEAGMSPSLGRQMRDEEEQDEQVKKPATRNRRDK